MAYANQNLRRKNLWGGVGLTPPLVTEGLRFTQYNFLSQLLPKDKRGHKRPLSNLKAHMIQFLKSVITKWQERSQETLK